MFQGWLGVEVGGGVGQKSYCLLYFWVLSQGCGDIETWKCMSRYLSSLALYSDYFISGFFFSFWPAFVWTISRSSGKLCAHGWGSVDLFIIWMNAVCFIMYVCACGQRMCVYVCMHVCVCVTEDFWYKYLVWISWSISKLCRRHLDYMIYRITLARKSLAWREYTCNTKTSRTRSEILPTVLVTYNRQYFNFRCRSITDITKLSTLSQNNAMMIFVLVKIIVFCLWGTISECFQYYYIIQSKHC